MNALTVAVKVFWLPRRGVTALVRVWLFVDWLEFSGAELDPTDSKQVAPTAAVELEASRPDPYCQLIRGAQQTLGHAGDRTVRRDSLLRLSR